MQKLCIIFGGQSSEHKDSVESFENLYNKIKTEADDTRFVLAAVIYVDLTNTFHWHPVDFDKEPAYYFEEGAAISMWDALLRIRENNYFLFSTLFSQNGEDGRMQGVCGFLGITSNLGNPLQPSLCLSKYHLNQYVTGVIPDVKVPATVRISSLSGIENVLSAFWGIEIVIKPNALGSSILTDKIILTADKMDEVTDMVSKILYHDDYALVQEYVEGEEFTCGVLQRGNDIQVLPLGQVRTNRAFFGFPEKNDAALNAKALINTSDNQTLEKLKEASRRIFADLDLRNMARFDFIVRNNEIYFLECNQFPSLHRYSFFMLMLSAVSLKVSDVIAFIIENENTRPRKEAVFNGYKNNYHGIR